MHEFNHNDDCQPQINKIQTIALFLIICFYICDVKWWIHILYKKSNKSTKVKM